MCDVLSCLCNGRARASGFGAGGEEVVNDDVVIWQMKVDATCKEERWISYGRPLERRMLAGRGGEGRELREERQGVCYKEKKNSDNLDYGCCTHSSLRVQGDFGAC